MLWNGKGLACETNTRDNSWNYIHVYYVWQSQVEIKHYSVAYFDHITALQMLKCRTLAKGGARICCINVVSIHEFTHCV